MSASGNGRTIAPVQRCIAIYRGIQVFMSLHAIVNHGYSNGSRTCGNGPGLGPVNVNVGRTGVSVYGLTGIVHLELLGIERVGCTRNLCIEIGMAELYQTAFANDIGYVQNLINVVHFQQDVAVLRIEIFHILTIYIRAERLPAQPPLHAKYDAVSQIKREAILQSLCVADAAHGFGIQAQALQQVRSLNSRLLPSQLHHGTSPKGEKTDFLHFVFTGSYLLYSLLHIDTLLKVNHHRSVVFRERNLPVVRPVIGGFLRLQGN